VKREAAALPPSTPYRTAGDVPCTPEPEGLDDRPVLWFLVCVGALRTVSVVVRGEAWDAGAVVLALLMGAAAWELYALARRARTLP
jgi:hypothetical protein